MNSVIHHINEEFNNSESGSMKQSLRRELIKLVAKVAEVFEGRMISQIAKISAFYSKRTKDTSD